MNKSCYIHIPKTGGKSIENMLHIKHDHSPIIPTCKHAYITIRDPVDRLSSAYHFCKINPWDRILKQRNLNSSHICHSSIVHSLSFPLWIIYALSRNNSDLQMPGVGFPHSFIAPNTYWENGSNIKKTYLRTHCLNKDINLTMHKAVKKTNTSPNKDCLQNLTDTAWNAITNHYRKDFIMIYNKTFHNVNNWRYACLNKGC